MIGGRLPFLAYLRATFLSFLSDLIVFSDEIRASRLFFHSLVED